MSKGRSYKNDTWASFDKQSFSLFKDDFVHDKLLTVKTGVQTTTGGVNLKQTLTNTNGTLASAGQTKLWFQLKNSRSLFAKIQHKALSLAYDHGIQEKDQKSFNWYGSVESNRNLQNFSWKAGVQIFKSSMSNNFLVQFNQDNRLLNLHHKALVKHNNWTFNSYKTLDLTNKVFKSAGFLVAHRRVVDQKNKDAFLRIENTNKDGLDLNSSSVHLDFVCNKQNVTSGLELVSSVGKLKQGLNPKGWIDSFSGAVQIKYPQNNTTFKLKVSSNLSAAISVKHALLGYGSYTWGVDMSEIGTKNNVRFGIQVDLNL